jgi:hypothetical protein
MEQFRWVLEIIFAVAICWYIEVQVGKTKRWIEGLVAATKDPAATPPKVITAEQFILVDGRGVARASLYMEDGIHPALGLFDEDGTRPNYFMRTPTGAVIRIGNREGEEIMLSIGHCRGEVDDPVARITVQDRNGFTALVGREERWPDDDAKGKPRAASAASIRLTDNEGRIVWSAETA